MSTARRAFIRDNTEIIAPPHVPEIRLHLASEAHDLWLKTAQDMEDIGLPPPFWAFAWAGGQGLARYILDHPRHVAGRTVIDFASGSGLVAIAAVKAGAARVCAVDIDPFAQAAVAMNAALNAVDIDFVLSDAIGTPRSADIYLAGDVFYDKAFADRLIPWFRDLHRQGADILIGDPGRTYCPADLMEQLATSQVSVTRALEDSDVKTTTVWRFAGSSLRERGIV